MAATLPEETELIERHEEILRKRAELLEQMENRREQLKILRTKHGNMCEDARCRNATLLQDLQKIEDGLRERRLPLPTLLALETRYWASVEESIPAWEQYLLGKTPHLVDRSGQRHRQATQKTTEVAVKDCGLPPLPQPRTVR